MKKICQKIKLWKFKTNLTEESLKNLEGSDFYVLFRDGTWEWATSKSDVATMIENNHKRPIKYIFDAVDRIILDRNILIDFDNI